MPKVSKEQFEELLKDLLGTAWARAANVFEEYSPNLTFDTTNVLLHAAKQGPAKVEEVLGIMEEHVAKHWGYTHPEARGLVTDWTKRDYTQAMFLRICTEVLNLQPQPHSV